MKKKILIIDDNQDMLRIMEHVLLHQGFLPLCFTSIEILSDLEEISPAMILLDVKLLDADGLDVCKKLKADPVSMDIPVILVSALSNLEQLAKDGCADAYLKKPFNIGELEKVVKRVLEIN